MHWRDIALTVASLSVILGCSTAVITRGEVNPMPLHQGTP